MKNEDTGNGGVAVHDYNHGHAPEQPPQVFDYKHLNAPSEQQQPEVDTNISQESNVIDYNHGKTETASAPPNDFQYNNNWNYQASAPANWNENAFYQQPHAWNQNWNQANNLDNQEQHNNHNNFDNDRHAPHFDHNNHHSQSFANDHSEENTPGKNVIKYIIISIW